jgi:uncharacterized membrane protein YfcA
MDPLLVVAGLGIGLLVGMTGMGGGSLMTPILILLFGTAPTTAIGSDIAYAAITKTVGGWRHLRLKSVTSRTRSAGTWTSRSWARSCLVRSLVSRSEAI